MENVTTLPTGVNAPATVEAVIEWVESQKNKADMGESGARMRTTSLRQMQEQVAPDEPMTAQWLHDNMEHMRARWARRNPEGKASTGKTYASRARATIREFLDWHASGGKFDPFSRSQKPSAAEAKSSGGSKKSQSRRKKEAVPAAPTEPLAAPASAPSHGKSRSYEVEAGEIIFQLPSDGVTFNDVKKFAVHLLTLATDFDISSPEQGQLFAMVVRGNRD